MLRNDQLDQWDHDHFFHPSTHLGQFARGELKNRIVTGGEGVHISDREGNKLLDAFAGLYCVNIGYGRQEVADAIAEQARELYGEALELLEQIIAEKRFTARGIYGFFPANADGDDVIVWTDDDRREERTRFHTLRQQVAKENKKPHVALADYVAASTADYVGGFVVGIHGADEWAREVSEKETDPYKSIMIKAIADRLAEAFAELLHHRARVEWGYERPNEFNHNELIKEKYRGIRPAPGYPAQPDHTEKPLLFELLGASEGTGVTLTESCAMHPGAAVSGLLFSHPESRYFAISELQKDQVGDYARRKGWTQTEAEKWLGPWLGYDA